MIKCSVITAVYNSHKTLPKFLLALSAQTEKDFELIVSDDGSKESHLPLLDEHQKHFRYPIKYLTQRRDGIQKTKALNRGIFASESAYLLFIDPDCLAAPNWVETHLREREAGRYLVGRRTDYRNEKMNGRITEKNITSGEFSKLNFENFFRYITFNLKHFKQMLRIKNRLLLNILHHNTSNYLWGCNFSCWKTDLLKVNGWDNDYKGLGAEDAELDVRLKNSGLVPKSIRFMTNVFHLFHKTRKNNEWLEYFRSRMEQKQVRVENGINAFPDEPNEHSPDILFAADRARQCDRNIGKHLIH